MKIYLDIFFVVNFAMNLLIIEIMNIFLKKRPISIRSISAAAAGALAAVIVVVTGAKEQRTVFLFLYLFVSCLMIRITYGKTTIYGLIKHIVGFYITGVAVAGALLFLKGTAGIGQISILFLLSAALLILFTAQKIISWRSRESKSMQNVFPVTIEYNGRRVTATGFLDTGNHLYEPVSHECVSVVEYDLFQKLLSEEERADFSKAVYDREPEMFGKLLLRYIPFHSLGKECDYLPGVRADNMAIQIDDSKTVCTGKLWLGICDHFLSSDSEYEVLLNSRVFGK